MKISDLKNYHAQRIRNIVEKGCNDDIVASVEFGIKKLSVAIQRVWKHEYVSPKGVKRTSEQYEVKLKINLKNEETLDNCIFVVATISNVSPFKKEDSMITNDVIKDIYKELIQYWLTYKKIKGLNGAFFRYIYDNKFGPNFSDILKEMGLEKGTELNKFLDFSKYHFKFDYGQLNEEKMEEYARYFDLAKQIDEAQEKNPSFKITKWIEADGDFLWDKKVYYFEGVEFLILATAEKVILKRENEQEFNYGEDVIEKVLESISTERRMHNLIETPIKFTDDFLRGGLLIYCGKERIKEIVSQVDDELGFGIMEKEASLLCDEVEYKQTCLDNKWTSGEEFKRRYKEIKGDVFNVYRFCTPSYFWFVLTQPDSERKKTWLYYTPNQGWEDIQYPPGLSQQINEIMIQKLTK